MPAEDVDEVELRWPGWIIAQLTTITGQIEARLRKRYATPFGEPYPEVLRSWLTRMTTVRAYLKRGVNASDAQFQVVVDDAKAADLEIKEAADAVEGLYDLPLRDGNDASAISKGSPLSATETDPYTWTDVQAEAFSG